MVMHYPASKSKGVACISKLGLETTDASGFFGKDGLLWICRWKCYKFYAKNYMHERDGFYQKVPKALGDKSKGGGGKEVSVHTKKVIFCL